MEKEGDEKEPDAIAATWQRRTHRHQSEDHVDGANAQSQVLGLLEISLEHSGGIIDDLQDAVSI